MKGVVTAGLALSQPFEGMNTVAAAANAGIARANIIAAMTSATVNTTRMRLIEATSSCSRQPPVGCSVKENYGARGVGGTS